MSGCEILISEPKSISKLSRKGETFRFGFLWEFLEFFCYLGIFFFFWVLVSRRWSEITILRTRVTVTDKWKPRRRGDCFWFFVLRVEEFFVFHRGFVLRGEFCVSRRWPARDRAAERELCCHWTHCSETKKWLAESRRASSPLSLVNILAS